MFISAWFRDLEQEFREKLSALRSETEQENEVMLQQVEKERDKLSEELELLKSQEANLQEEATTAIKVTKGYRYILVSKSLASALS